MKRFLALVGLLVIVLFAVTASAQSKPPLRLLQSIPLPDLKEGDFDHFAVDLAGNRLFATAEENNAVVVLDTKANKLIHTITGLAAPHSMLFLPAAKQLWVVSGDDGTVKIFNTGTYALTETVKVTKGAEHVGVYHKTDRSHRQFCKLCGGHLMTNHPPISLVDVFAATIPALAFTPGVHVNYAETVLPMRDGLPKLRDFPAEFGGSGETMAE